MDRYGVTNGSATTQAKTKRREKALERFGVDNVAKSPEVINKFMTTREQKYGCRGLLSNPEVRKKASDNFYKRTGKKWWTGGEKWRAKCEKTSLDEFGVSHFMKDPALRKKTRLRYVYNGIGFDSSWELAVYIWLVDNKVDFEFQPSEPQLTYVDFDGKTKRYCPDFKIGDQLVEIKGDNLFNKDHEPIMLTYNWKAKYDCMIANNVEIWTSKIVKPYLEYIDKKYGRGYLKQFRKQPTSR